MSKETHFIVQHGVPNIQAIERVFKALVADGFKVYSIHTTSDHSFLGMPARPKATVEVSIFKPISNEILEPEFKPGKKVYLPDGRECLYIGPHPEHSAHVLETPENEFITRTTEDIHKEPVKPTPLYIPWASIDEKWQYAAMDLDKRVFLFTDKPSLDPDEWNSDTHEEKLISNLLRISTKDINWKLSLTKRPSPCTGPKHVNCRCAIIDPLNVTISNHLRPTKGDWLDEMFSKTPVRLS